MTLRTPALLCLTLILSTFATAVWAADAPTFNGHWEGSIEIPNSPLVIKVDLTQDGKSVSGTIDIPAQAARGLPLDKLEAAGGSIRFSIANIPGAPTFDGTLKDDKIAGTFKQGGGAFPFKLARTGSVAVVKSAPKRPQEPKPPFPYKCEEVGYENGAVHLAATLTLPSGKGPFPAVVLITGSGAQNRDEELMGHKPFLVLADHLTRAGVAVLRADDRGVGGSTGDFLNSTSSDFTDDALAGVVFLNTRPEIAHDRIGLAGHSEGGLIAPLAATRSKDVAFIVMLAGTGVPGGEIAQKQIELMLQAGGSSPEYIKRHLAFNEKLIALAMSDPAKAVLDARIVELVDEYFAQLSETERKAAGSAKALLPKIQAGMATGPWTRYFIRYDPRPTLKKVTVPVLALNGDLDTQVSAEQNIPEIEKALKEAPTKDITIKRFPGLNHLFQKAKTGALEEYAENEETMNPEVLKMISDWIVKRFVTR